LRAAVARDATYTRLWLWVPDLRARRGAMRRTPVCLRDDGGRVCGFRFQTPKRM
jgi:hypothetical protein